jgi:hypothetical protein
MGVSLFEIKFDKAMLYFSTFKRSSSFLEIALSTIFDLIGPIVEIMFYLK